MAERFELDGQHLELGEVIGTGATSIVYACQLADGRDAAIKTLHAHLYNSSEAVSRYAREVEALAQLTHPNAVRLFGHGESSVGRPFVVMERLRGEPLDMIVKRDGPMRVERLLPLFIDVCEAVAEAHRVGLVHRDIKPENLFVETHGGSEAIKVIDFGFVRFSPDGGEERHSAVTIQGTRLGTPGFMSPEQSRGETADARSDVHALAVSLYECLCGAMPFDKAGSKAGGEYLNKPPIPLNKRVKGMTFAPSLDAALLRAMARDRDERTATVDDFVAQLRAVLAETRAPAPIPQNFPTHRAPVSSQAPIIIPRKEVNRRFWAIGLVLFAAAILGGLFLAYRS